MNIKQLVEIVNTRIIPIFKLQKPPQWGDWNWHGLADDLETAINAPEEPAKTVKLTDEFHQDEPLGYLVKNYNDMVNEYLVFEHEVPARDHARRQSTAASEAGEPQDFQVFPLYASHPI